MKDLVDWLEMEVRKIVLGAERRERANLAVEKDILMRKQILVV